MAHPAVRLHAPLRVASGSRADDAEALTPVERAITEEHAALEALGEDRRVAGERGLPHRVGEEGVVPHEYWRTAARASAPIRTT